MITKVHNHLTNLVTLNDHAYLNYLDDLISELSHTQPLQWMIKGSINNASKPFAYEPHRDYLFQKLIDFDLTHTAYETFEMVTGLIPIPVKELDCHIIPAIESKGGGACYAPGKILLAVRIDEHSPMRLKRNIAHEYSHTVRYVQKPLENEFGHGEAIPYTVRDFLIFEGLASVLPEVLFPYPEFLPTAVTSKDEDDFWEKTNLDEVGTDAYIKYIGMKAYEIGARIVRKYLSTHNISITEAHNLSNEELYWNSGYPLLR